jgi:hypothetical protein
MRTIVGVLLVLVVVSACGDESSPADVTDTSDVVDDGAGPDADADADVGADADVDADADPDAEAGEDGIAADDGSGDAVCEAGAVEGVTCAPNGQVFPATLVRLEGTDCTGSSRSFEVESDGYGEWRFDAVPAGTWTLTLSRGPFLRVSAVTVAVGATTILEGDDAVCFEAASGDGIVIVTGAYDTVDVVLDELGFSYDVVVGDEVWTGWEFLLDAEALLAYHVIYLACGIHPEANYGSYRSGLDEIGANLRAFVEAGNHVYASDWSFAFVEAAAPELFDFHGADDLDVYDVLTGANGIVSADVINPVLAEYLGVETVELNFAVPQWAVADGAVSGARIDLTGTVTLMDSSSQPGAVIAARVPLGAGSLIFTSMHQDADDSLSTPLIHWLATAF